MTRRSSHSVAIALVAALLVAGALWGWRSVRPLLPAFGPRADTPTPALSGPVAARSPAASVPAEPDGPLTAAPGYRVTLVTDDVPGARDMELDPFGNVWVSQTAEGTVSLVYLKDKEIPEAGPVLRDLRKPHGLAFDPEHSTALYVATETEILRVPTYSDGSPEHIADLPAGGRHFTRSLAFGPDGRLYVSIGSTCDVCYEQNPEHGTIISMKRDGTDRRIEAKGLRNAVFLQFESSLPGVALFMTEMGRDHLGDNLPPDEVNAFLPGEGSMPPDFGWPVCYGNRVHDTQFDKNQYVRDPCADTATPEISLPAHVAPLGFAFFGPAHDILVAYHGSWNSSVPVGYKVVRWTLDRYGDWQSEDFLTGFLKGGQAVGRPVDVLPMPDGSVLVSDDKAGAIWRVAPE